MIYLAVLIGVVIGVAGIVGYLNWPDQNEKEYNVAIDARIKAKRSKP